MGAASTTRALLGALCLITLLPSPARSSGAFFVERGEHAPLSGAQRALIVVDGEKVTATFQLQYLGSSGGGDEADFVWLLPVGGELVGQAILDDEEIFHDLEVYTAPRQVEFPGGCAPHDCTRFEVPEVTMGPGEEPWTGTPLAGLVLSRPDGIEDPLAWLDEQQMAADHETRELIGSMSSSGFDFVGLEAEPLKAAEEQPSEPLRPITVSWRGEVVYPAALSSHSTTGHLEAVVYLLSEHRMEAYNIDTVEVELDNTHMEGDLQTLYNARLEELLDQAGGRAAMVEFAGPVTGSLGERLEQELAGSSPRFLTRFRLMFRSRTIDRNVLFVPASTDEFHRVRVVASASPLAGPDLLVLVLLALVVHRRRGSS